MREALLANILYPRLSLSVRPLVAIASLLAFAASSPATAHQGEPENAAANASATRQAHDSDADGDGHASRAKFKGGKALADTVKHRRDQPASAEQPGGSGAASPQTSRTVEREPARRAGDPIPGIDITVSQSPDTAE
jgi:hypothetical protein